MLLVQAVERLGQIQIPLGDTVAHMGGEDGHDPAVAEGEIRMMIHLFGVFRRGHHEAEAPGIG